jgi:hypothetical protein
MVETPNQESISKLNYNLLQELEVMFLEYSERRGFPDGACTMVSKDIAESLRFRYREGYFKLDSPNGKGILSPTHAWCEDAERTIIDLTAHQFNPYLQDKLPWGAQIIRPENPLYRRYILLSNNKRA